LYDLYKGVFNIKRSKGNIEQFCNYKYINNKYYFTYNFMYLFTFFGKILFYLIINMFVCNKKNNNIL